MAYRVLPDGTIETDTLDDALKARDAVLGRKTNQRHARGIVTKKSDTLLSDVTKAFLRALVQSPNGLTSTQAATAAGIGTKSLPPVIRGLNEFCRRKHIVMDSLVTRKTKFENRRPVSLYALTEEGRRFFEPTLKAHSSNEKSKGDAEN
jgi:hypothetical protein